ncbi:MULTISPECIES: TRAP transporter small permease subunit [Hydrogenophilus]|uniref:TRAP transporter small permease protein n=1 Tax=Hydrogenophilus thermoluteolus TaxID=297 RepID=A0A2Z6DWX1_HYDTE|nr:MULTISPECIES: TRAP transporter small permease subunit [Hydrogenophilus]HCO78269.1 C4-dicarboxylate ABC transporter substrate-binding protein [Rhodocyclaceae bacterium]MBW7657169.1 TRAP transporter small permease subunit [Hydrogenophilus thermoluteolus]BBD76961.1 C4-dicarboxylate ABC transporter substrate-binding protein [Hydrogenophilus thermoluteolus]GLW60002.1 C4-dicarboxylate ABC transporter substrate-binding protein [Hydrogenophilus thermoluteolus]HNQ48348.1 TRAP transporter small perme
MQPLLRICAVIDTLNRSLGRLFFWFTLAATAISAANALVRKLFDTSSNAFLEIQWYLFAAVFMLGLGYGFLENAHVRIDVVANRLSARTRNLIDAIGIVVFVFPLCYFMANFAWPIVVQAYTTGEMSSNAGGLIRWPLYALVPAGYGLLAIQAFSELIKRIAFLLGHGPDPLKQANPH